MLFVSTYRSISNALRQHTSKIKKAFIQERWQKAVVNNHICIVLCLHSLQKLLHQFSFTDSNINAHSPNVKSEIKSEPKGSDGDSQVSSKEVEGNSIEMSHLFDYIIIIIVKG